MFKRIFLTTIFIVCFLTGLFAQSGSIDINVKNASLSEIISLIETQTSYTFSYQESTVSGINGITIKYKGKNIERLLKKILLSHGLSYTIINKTYIVIFANSLNGSVSDSQSFIVSGHVVDKDGETVMGASIRQHGTGNNTISDIDGNFKLTISDREKPLEISYIGYESVIKKPAAAMHIVMQPYVQQIDNIVIVGYGQMSRVHTTQAIDTVPVKMMQKFTPINVGNMLQGSVSSLYVTNSGGAPSSSSAVRMRGISSINNITTPLYVVDEVPIGYNVDFINPYDIENISVLKDAAATAIYGFRGANGVILIKTKTGSVGKLSIYGNASLGISSVARNMETVNVEDYAKLIRAGHKADGSNIIMPIWSEQYDGLRKNISWNDELQRSAVTQKYNISFSGGSEKLRGIASLGYVSNEGVLVNSSYEKYSVDINVKSNPVPFLMINGKINFAHIKNQDNSLSQLTYSVSPPSMDYTDGSNIVSPNVVNADGTYGTYYQSSSWCEVGKGEDNLYALQQDKNGVTNNNIALVSLNTDWRLFKNLSLKIIASYYYENNDSYVRDQAPARYNNGLLCTLLNDNIYGTFSMTQSNNYTQNLECYLDYKWKNAYHYVYAILGNSVYRNWSRWANASESLLSTSDMERIEYSDKTTNITASGGFNRELRFLSYYARVIYSYMDRYNAQIALRNDGSSNFSKNNRWGLFPSFSFSWNVKKENFMKSCDWMKNLKIMVGWGITGNAGYATDKSVQQISSNNISYNFYSEGSSSQTGRSNTGYASISLADVDLRWEKCKQTNIGVDLSVLDGKLKFSSDYYIRINNDLLLLTSVRPSTGYTSVYTNLGKIMNTGLEFSIDYSQQIGTDCRLNMKFTGTSLKNRFEGDVQDIFGSNYINKGLYWANSSISRSGYAVGSFYGYISDGLFTDQAELDELNAKAKSKGYSDGYQMLKTSLGDIKYKDLNGDGHIDSNDMTIFGNGQPKFTFGFNTSVEYKNWDLSLFTYGALGKDILSYSAMRLSVISSSDSYVPAILSDSYKKAWSSDNPGGTLPRLTILDENHNSRCSDFWLRKGDYFKLKYLQVGYTFSDAIDRVLGVSHLRIYLMATNLLCVSPYNKYGDPEFSNTILNNGVDYGKYPTSRQFSAGLEISF